MKQRKPKNKMKSMNYISNYVRTDCPNENEVRESRAVLQV